MALQFPNVILHFVETQGGVSTEVMYVRLQIKEKLPKSFVSIMHARRDES